MFSEKLPNPIALNSGYSFNENIDLLYDYFKKDLMDQSNRNQLFGKFIYIDCTKWINRKNELFWHLISLNQREQFNVLPCNNCGSYTFCPNINCMTSNEVVTLSNREARNICLYRGVRIKWVNEIIELANKGDEHVMVWKEEITGKRLNKKLHLRFNHQAADYIVILEERYRRGTIKDYFLITAFPVFYINKKDTFWKKYQEYKKYEANIFN